MAEVNSDFAAVVYENLKASGVQNTKKGGSDPVRMAEAARLALRPRSLRGPLSSKAAR
jgi:hypothetical protein